jgi:DNA polymerase-3 subunit delta'
MHSNWNTVIGQERVKRILRTALKQRRIAHAYLISGDEGVGCDAVAIELARTLLCDTASDTACGTCPSCTKASTLHHPDLKLIFPLPGKDNGKSDDDETPEDEFFEEIRRQTAEKAKNPYFHIEIPKAKIIPIRSIRQIKKESSMSSTEKGKKVFIILDADAMNDYSSNSFLKVLEEPLEHVHFILTTSRKDALKQTIVSRCQVLQCSRLTEGEIKQALMERESVPESDAATRAKLSGGSYDRALQLVREDLDRYRIDAVKFLRSMLGSSPIRFFEEQEEYLTGNRRDEAEHLLTMLHVFFRDAVVMREHSTAIINIDQEPDLRSFVAKFGRKDLEQCLPAVERALELLRRNVYLPLVMLTVTIHIRSILNAQRT